MEKNKKKTVPMKGEIGYIRFRKKLSGLLTLGLFLIATAIFVAGLLIYDFQKGNLFTVVAALFIIPAARAMTNFILFFPYKSVSPEDYAEVEAVAKNGSIIYTELVLTSEERAMNLDYMVVTATKIIAYSANKKTNIMKTQEYLKDFIRRKGFGWNITVLDDKKKFMSMLSLSDASDRSQFENDEDWEQFSADRNEMLEHIEGTMA